MKQKPIKTEWNLKKILQIKQTHFKLKRLVGYGSVTALETVQDTPNA